MKKMFLFLLFAMTIKLSFANDLTILRLGAPGANYDLYTAAMTARLKDKGWNANLMGFADCKGAEQWIKNNPKKPVMYMTWSDDFILPSIDPAHPRSCNDLTISESTLVTPAAQSYHMICSKNESSVDRFTSHANAKIGIWNHPVQTEVLKDILLDLKLKHKIVGFAKGADLMQALVSGDIDYVIVSSENLIRNIQGHCFMTTAPIDKAKNLSDFKSGRQTSIETLVKNPTRVGTGLIPVYVAYNVNVGSLRKDVADILNNSPEYSNQWSSSTVKAGVVAGETSSEQWKKFSKFLSSFKK